MRIGEHKFLLLRLLPAPLSLWVDNSSECHSTDEQTSAEDSRFLHTKLILIKISSLNCKRDIERARGWWSHTIGAAASAVFERLMNLCVPSVWFKRNETKPKWKRGPLFALCRIHTSSDDFGMIPNNKVLREKVLSDNSLHNSANAFGELKVYDWCVNPFKPSAKHQSSILRRQLIVARFFISPRHLQTHRLNPSLIPSLSLSIYSESLDSRKTKTYWLLHKPWRRVIKFCVARDDERK